MNSTSRDGLALMRISMRAIAAVSWLLFTGCSGLLPAPPPPITFFALEAAPAAAAQPTTRTRFNAMTLVVSPMRVAPGFDSSRIVYVRTPQRRESFALSEWVDTPARMLVPLMVAALANDAVHRAVVSAGTAVDADLRLDTELIRLQQQFDKGSSQVRLTVRATLFDARKLKVVAWREFDVEQPADSPDASGGVAAAQLAVRSMLAQLTSFCREAVIMLPP